MFRKLRPFLLLAFLSLAPHASAADLVIDGVPFPSDAAVSEPSPGNSFRQWSGAWVGMWGDGLKHILLVEAIAEDGAARVVYAVGDKPYASWLRLGAVASGRTLKVTGSGFSANYEMTGDGSLKAQFERGANTSSAVMTRSDLASLRKPDAVIAWTRRTFEFLQTDLIEDGKPVRLEVVIYPPAGAGPFPLAVINHGSTGRGSNQAAFTQTWLAGDLAHFLNERGWLVAFPQRRGRGKSDGLYDEGFLRNRTLGYACETNITLRGADRALEDIEAAISALRRRPDVAPTPVLLGGNSRGGVLSIAYAGQHPEQIAGVINFVGGWLGENCPVSTAVNHALFERGAPYTRPTLWLYAQNDTFYSIPHSRDNFAAFEKAGGIGKFLEFELPSGQGHGVIRRANLWSGPIESYLNSLGKQD